MDRKRFPEEYLPLINMKRSGQNKNLGRTTSVITDPQGSLLTAIKESNYELFVDILDDEECRNAIDLDHACEDEAGKTLMHLAVEQEDLEFVRLLLKSGAKVNIFNRARSTPLHVAARKGYVGIFQVLLASGRADVNAVTSNGQNVLHILVKKIGSGQDGDPEAFLECLKLAIRQPEIDIDKPEDTASMTPLFLAADEAKSRRAAVMLIKSGAKIDLQVDGQSLKDLLVKEFGNDILTITPTERPSGSSRRSKLLRLLHESVVRDTTDDFKKLVKDVQDVGNDINSAPAGDLTLIQVACDENLPDHLQAMLDLDGSDPNAIGEGTAPGLILAAKAGHAQVLKVLLGQSKLDMKASYDQATVLHTVLRKPLPRKSYDWALEVLLDPDNVTRMRGIINRKDLLGNTALHYATQMWPQTVVRTLLEMGANIGLQNIYEEVPINRILPETMEAFLTEHCLTSEGNVTNENFKITAKFDFLVPFGTDFETDDNDNNMDHAKENNVEEGVKEAGNNQVPLPETEGLWYMSQSKKHRHLLKHPVIASFLWMKWKRIGAAYNRNLAFYATFVALITAYIFVLYSGNAIRADNYSVEKCDASLNFNGNKNNADGITALWYVVTIFTIGLAVREVLQVGIAPRRYFFSPENWVEIILIVLALIMLFDGNYGCHVRTKRHLGAVIIVLSWSELITMVGRHPRLNLINIYVTMFYRVLGTFILFLMWYSLFIVAFGLGFYILLHQDHDQPDPDHEYVFFDSIGLCIVKTFTMFVGELEFGDLPIETPTGYLFLLAFVFLIVVVMMNLLNGLAVSDTGVIRAEAEIHAYKTQVEIISYIESTVLGDPFNFLANWPTFVWLRRIPTCSIVGGGRLYRIPPLREAFHKMTRAKNIMLFQGTGTGSADPHAAHGYRVTFYPNREDAGLSFLCCCCGDREDMQAYADFPDTVVDSAKEVVLELLKTRDEDNLEQRLTRIEAMLEQLLNNR